MPKVDLSRMNVEALMDLRKRVDELLLKHRAELQKQLERMDLLGGERVARRGSRSALKGRKVPPFVVHLAKHGQDAALDLGGSLRRSKKEGNSTTF
jgi:hypothetical protein